jgi:hypothetical protein
VRWAVLASLAVHGALGWFLVSRPASRPVVVVREARPDVVEVSLDLGEVGAGPAIPRPASPGGAARADLSPTTRESARPGGASRGEPGESRRPAAPELPAQLPSVAALPTGAAAPAEPDRLATFRPAHPNLREPGNPPAPEERSRQLLAAPQIKDRPSPVDLPRVLRGPGGVNAKVEPDGRIHLAGPPDVVKNDSPYMVVGEGVGVGISGHLDLTDQVMKLAKQDAYAAAKQELADQTREARLCMARRYQGEQRKQELFTLATKVRRLAARSALSATERRALIFDIWDECSEEGGGGQDYGAMARATILAVVREVFPAGTDRAYQPAELLALNQRRSSRQEFAPYNSLIPPLVPPEQRRGRHPDAGAPGECPIE